MKNPRCSRIFSFRVIRSRTFYITKSVFSNIQIHEIPTNTQVFDWTIPKEWNITDAYVSDSEGNKVVDFKKSNLHVVSYSTPIRKKMSLVEINNSDYLDALQSVVYDHVEERFVNNANETNDIIEIQNID